MHQVKYVCLSDFHLGSPTALLTDTPEGFSDKNATAELRDAFSKAFVATLAALNGAAADTPGVVLLGDVFDLSLGTPKSSIDNFDKLLKSLAEAGAQEQVGDFVFIPGNHDHELWTVSRFQHMVGATRSEDRFNHTTPAFGDIADRPRAVQIDDLLRANGFSGATTVYPNMGLISKDKTRAVVLHHGHYIESIYRAMSTLTMMLDGEKEISLDVETLEQLNANWIDFLWSNDGDNGRLGADVMHSYHAMMTGVADIRLDHKLAHILADKLMTNMPMSSTATGRVWAENAAKAVVDSFLGNYSDMERFSYQKVLGPDGVEGLKSYLTGSVLPQLLQEKPDHKVADLTFIFGHTHKPFETRIAAEGMAKPTAVYNTGGWELGTPMFGTRLGAAAVFVDDDLHTASLRLCDVPQADEETEPYPAPPPVRVATADGTTVNNPMAQALQAAIDACASEWQAFSDQAARAYRIKQIYSMKLVDAIPTPDTTKRSASA